MSHKIKLSIFIFNYEHTKVKGGNYFIFILYWMGSISFRMDFSVVGWIFLLQAEFFCFFWNVGKWKEIHCHSSHQLFVLRGHPYITSAKGLGGWGQKIGNFFWRSVPFMQTKGGWWIRKRPKNCWRSIGMVTNATAAIWLSMPFAFSFLHVAIYIVLYQKEGLFKNKLL